MFSPFVVTKVLQWTGVAQRLLSTDALGVFINEGMELLVHLNVRRYFRFNEFLYALVVVRTIPDAKTCEYTVRVSVDDEGGFVGGVEDDGVCRFRPNSFHGEQGFSQFAQREREEPFQSTIILDEFAYRFQSLHLLVVKASRPYEFAKDVIGRLENALRVHKPLSLQIVNCLLNVSPSSVLSENCPDNNFKGRLRWPPVLRAVER